MSNIQDLDLIIIGAGPAGISTALHLIQGDPSWAGRMILLEKETHPRSKLCGGGVTWIGIETLKRLDFPLPLPLEQSRVENIYLKYKKQMIHVQGKPLFVVIDRPVFDHYLLEQAKKRGIKIKEDEPVLSISINKDHVFVHSENCDYRAKMIVCADGATGTISSRILREHSQNRMSRTLELWTPTTLNSPRFSKRSALFDFNYLSNNLQGYIWEFPSKVNGKPFHNRGVYDSRLFQKKERSNLPDILEKASNSIDGKEKDPPIRSAPIRMFSPKNKVSTHRTILVGDAAGVDVLFGEGISPSLLYGKFAAKEIHRAFEKDIFSFQAYQKRLLVSKLGRYLLIRWLVANYLYRFGSHPFFTHLLWTAGKILATFWQGRYLY